MNSTKMSSVQIWLCLVFVCCSAQRQDYACKWMTSQYGTVNGVALSLLRQMGGKICSEIVPFPERLYKNMEMSTAADQLGFMAEVVEQILNLFDHYDDAAGWDTGALDKFLHNESRQLIELKNCAAAHPNPRRKAYKVKRHFRQLKKILRKNNYNGESWEKIRRAVLLHLTRMAVMTGHV
ncbi:interferon a3-like [Astyanax mexicanus]|uniref:Interferon a3-like n=2 Tax=Astyanax mexicanus TaxID=7994 RepID=A0A8T2MDY4_ASTMX|nr:interferon a3-like [Astyanax mexicanus]